MEDAGGSVIVEEAVASTAIPPLTPAPRVAEEASAAVLPPTLVTTRGHGGGMPDD